MSKRWLNERRNDFYYRKAKQLNYRSRASFKLHQIDERSASSGRATRWSTWAPRREGGCRSPRSASVPRERWWAWTSSTSLPWRAWRRYAGT